MASAILYEFEAAPAASLPRPLDDARAIAAAADVPEVLLTCTGPPPASELGLRAPLANRTASQSTRPLGAYSLIWMSFACAFVRNVTDRRLQPFVLLVSGTVYSALSCASHTNSPRPPAAG